MRYLGIYKTRILIILLILTLVFSFCLPKTITADNNIPEQEGYIVVLDNDSNFDLDSNEFNEIVKDEIYQVDSLADIREEIPVKDIECIEPNYVLELCDTYVPNDSRYLDSKWTQDIMSVQKVWERGYFGNYTNSSDAPIVGIIDTGILGTGSNGAIEHEDLNYDNISGGKNTIDNSLNTNDDYGHGTFIAGIISALHNSVGIAGNMPDLNIKAYKCIDKYGQGTVAQEVAAIYAAIEDGVDVINISLGFDENSSIEQTAINEATRNGIIVCASAGNGGNSSWDYPASHDNTISVGSINNTMNKSDFSQYNKMVDCAAPGEGILSLDYNYFNGYRVNSGTSFSCPQVTALAAMCKSIDPSIDHDRFMELLKSTSRDAGIAGYDTSYGWGIIDYGNMLDALVPEDNSIWAGTITGISAEADYTGSAIIFDDLKITMPGGKVLSAGSDYTVAYYNNIDYSTAMITIQGTGLYTGRINKYFTINGAPKSNEPTDEPSSGGGGGGSFTPGGDSSDNSGDENKPVESAEPEPIKPEPIVVTVPTIKKLIAGKKSFTIKWKKVADIDGYRLQYSTTKTFKKGTYKKFTIAKNRVNYTVKKLKADKKYYVRMRSYRMVDGKKQYSNWTAERKIRVKQ